MKTVFFAANKVMEFIFKIRIINDQYLLYSLLLKPPPRLTMKRYYTSCYYSLRIKISTIVSFSFLSASLFMAQQSGYFYRDGTAAIVPPNTVLPVFGSGNHTLSRAGSDIAQSAIRLRMSSNTGLFRGDGKGLRRLKYCMVKRIIRT